MESLFEILFRASLSIALLYSLYWLLLRQSTHFNANRYFLLISLLISVGIAIVPIQYQVLIPAPSSPVLSEYNGVFNHDITNTTTNSQKSNGIGIFSVLLLVYSIGAVFILLRIFIQCRKPLLIISKSKPKKINDCLIHENKVYNSPFSFFNRILINSEYFKQNEISDILTHEEVHIHERHWIDLFIIELLTVFLWFNPFIWLFERAIKQNHEYLADEGVLSRGHSPVRYQALLINQLMGTQVIGLANHFCSAQGPTRFKMMTKEKTAKRKLFRMIWGIPVLAILLVAFAEPEYKKEAKNTDTEAFVSSEANADNIKISGKVINEDGISMHGTSIILKGTNIGTVVDKNGTFELDIPQSEKMALVISYVGYKTIVEKIKPVDKKVHFDFKLQRGIVNIDNKSMYLAGDVPPPPAPVEFSKSNKPVFIVVEDMPHYPGDRYGLGQYVKKKTSELKSKSGSKLSGKATVGFTITDKGEVSNIQILSKSNNSVAIATKQIIAGMEKWKPGSQRGKNVPVDFAMELEF